MYIFVLFDVCVLRLSNVNFVCGSSVVASLFSPTEERDFIASVVLMKTLAYITQELHPRNPVRLPIMYCTSAMYSPLSYLEEAHQCFFSQTVEAKNMAEFWEG